jgi:hypothetical protein
MKGDKQEVIVKGRVIKMSPIAAKIAMKHFGGSKDRPMANKFIPEELLNIPKLPITPAVKIVKEKIIEDEIKAEVVIVPADEVKQEVKEVKPTRRRKK